MSAANDSRLSIPFSSDAERAVLGALMLDNHAFDNVCEHVSADDFYHAANKHIYEAIEALAAENSPFDLLTMFDHIREKGHASDVGGPDYLSDVYDSCPSAANAVSYAKIVREKALLRGLIVVGGDLQERAKNPDGDKPDVIRDEYEQKLFDLGGGQGDNLGVMVTEALEEMLVDLDYRHKNPNETKGLSTGLTDLDSDINGFENSDLIILAARPSMGKTSLAMNLVQAPMLDGKNCVVFSLEMPKKQLMERLVSSVGTVELGRIRNPREMDDGDWSKVTAAFSMIKDKNLIIDDTSGLSPTQMRSRCRRYARQMGGGIDIIMVDYLQLMQASGCGNRTEEISKISRSLKALAKEFDCPVIALSQLNRSLEQRPNKRPIMSDLRESGAIEQDADLIMFIYRDEVYDEDSPDKGTAEIIRAKHRNGEIGTTRLSWLGKYTKFGNLAHGGY